MADIINWIDKTCKYVHDRQICQLQKCNDTHMGKPRNEQNLKCSKILPRESEWCSTEYQTFWSA